MKEKVRRQLRDGAIQIGFEVEKMTKVSAKNSGFGGAESDTENDPGNEPENEPEMRQ